MCTIQQYLERIESFATIQKKNIEDIKKLYEIIRKYKFLLENAKQHNTQLEVKLNEAKKVKDRSNEVTELREIVNLLESENEILRKERNEREQRATSYMKDMKQLKEQMKEVIDERDDLLTNIEENKRAMDKLKQTNTDLVTENSTFKLLHNELEKLRKEKERSQTESDEKYSNTLEDVKKMEQERDEFKKLFIEVNQVKDKNIKETEAIKIEISSIKNKYERIVADTKNEILRKLEIKVVECDKLNKELADAKATISALQQQLQEKCEEKGKLMKEIENKSIENKTLKEQIKQLEANCKDLHTRINKLTQELNIATRKEEADNLKATIIKLETNNTTFQRLIEEKQKEIKENQKERNAEIERLNLDKIKWEEIFNLRQQELITLSNTQKTEIELLKTELYSLKDQLNEKNKNMEHMNNELNLKSKELDKKTQEVDDLIRQTNRVKQDHQIEMKQIEAERIMLQKMIDLGKQELDITNKNHKAELDKLKKESEVLVIERETLKQEVINIRNSLQAIISDKEKTFSEESEGYIKEVSRLNEENLAYLKLIQELKKEIVNYKEECNKLECLCREKQEIYETNYKNLDDFKAKELADLKEEIWRLRKELDVVKENANEEISKLKEELFVSTKENKRLAMENAKIQRLLKEKEKLLITESEMYKEKIKEYMNICSKLKAEFTIIEKELNKDNTKNIFKKLNGLQNLLTESQVDTCEDSGSKMLIKYFHLFAWLMVRVISNDIRFSLSLLEYTVVHLNNY